MLVIATVQTDNYLGRGREYVAKLYSGVRRHLTRPWRGVCLTDDPATVPDGIEAVAPPERLDGWWHKLLLFRPGMFEPGTRVLYFDLDTLIRGSLDDIAGYAGRFAVLDRMPYGLASGVMAWEAGQADRIWTEWEANWRPIHPRGDQGWIQCVEPQCETLRQRYSGQLVSYKADCLAAGHPPAKARVVYFHGRPRIHECAAPWVRDLWNNGD